MARWWKKSSNSPAPVDAWDFYTGLGDGDRSQLDDVERAVAAICDLRQEVNSGGFDSYFRYWGGNTAPTALAALPEVLGQDWADLLTEAMALFSTEYPTGVDEREVALDAQDLDEVLDAIDKRHYALEAAIDADARMSAYLANR